MNFIASILALLGLGRSSAPAAPAVVVAPQPRPAEAPSAPPPIPVAVVGDAPRPAPPAAGLMIQDDRLRGATYIASPHVGGAIVPLFLVMHYTAGFLARDSVTAIANRGLSAHFFVDRDGTIIQTVPCNRQASHAGDSAWGKYEGLNPRSIGIEIANLGWLDRKGADGWTRAGLSRSLPDNQVVVAAHKHGGPVRAWEAYPEAQLRAVEDLTRAILAAYPAIKEVVGHDDISPGRKLDPGPAFPMARFRAFLRSI
ncbi:N-acetylmuramoyl-L-alanine amidase [Roseomonas sp. F4]